MNNHQTAVQTMLTLMREAAAQEILPRFGKVDEEMKGTAGDAEVMFNSVTEADLRASEYILEHIRPEFPGSYSEEHKHDDRFQHDFVWQIDPVDGTKEFTEEMIDGYASHAALLQRTKEGLYVPVAGIIHLPGIDETWYHDGIETVFLQQGERQDIPQPQRGQFRGWVRKVDPSMVLERFYQRAGEEINRRPGNAVHHGGAGATFAALLRGDLDVLIMNYDYTKDWDIAMAMPILEAQGGFICDLDGKPFTNLNRQDDAAGEPYVRNGYVASLAYKQGEIIPLVQPARLLEQKVKKSA